MLLVVVCVMATPCWVSPDDSAVKEHVSFRAVEPRRGCHILWAVPGDTVCACVCTCVYICMHIHVHVHSHVLNFLYMNVHCVHAHPAHTRLSMSNWKGMDCKLLACTYVNSWLVTRKCVHTLKTVKHTHSN